MLKFLKSPEKVFKAGMWGVSLMFAIFLIGLGGKIIEDAPKATQEVRIEDFTDRDALLALRTDIERLQRQVSDVELRKGKAQAELNSALNAYRGAQSTHNSWLATRHATSSNVKATVHDGELYRRTMELDQLGVAYRTAQSDVEKLDKELAEVALVHGNKNQTLEDMLMAAKPAYEHAMYWREVKIFVLRLILTLPLIAFSWWLVLKKRDGNHWPLARGFVIFSAFTFFVELVPYLPSFGGYVRYVVGIMVSVLAGHHGIRWMQRYLEQRKQAQQMTEKERRAALDPFLSLQKVVAGVCPGCGQNVAAHANSEVNHCVYCGLKLFDRCGGKQANGKVCGVRKNAFFPHCPSCGHEAQRVQDKPQDGVGVPA